MIKAEVVSNETATTKNHDELSEWTFYKFDTQKGGVTIRWYGGSNGYYSVDVSFGIVECHERLDN